MSVDESVFLPEIRLLEYTAVPWEGRKDGMTVNLVLYFILQLANESNESRPLDPPLRAAIQTSPHPEAKILQERNVAQERLLDSAGTSLYYSWPTAACRRRFSNFVVLFLYSIVHGKL